VFNVFFVEGQKDVTKYQNNFFQTKLKCLIGEMVIKEQQLAAYLVLTACQ
jgi:hypothetical protein